MYHYSTRPITRLALALTLALGSLPASLRSQDASRPDVGFGVNGVSVVTDGITPAGGKVTVDSQGRIVTVGTAFSGSFPYVCVIRRLSNGVLDANFGTGGIARFGGTSKGVVIDQADNILVLLDFVVSGSQKDIYVLRLLGGGANAGTLDPSFGPASGAYVLSTLNATPAPADSNAGGIAIQGDGRIVIVGDAFNPAATNNGTQDLIVVRLTPQGFVDPSFNAGSPLYFGNLQEEFAMGAAVDSQGRIFVAALHNTFTRVYRVTSAGLPDPSVGNPNGGFEYLNGTIMLGNNILPTGIAVDSDDSVLVCGHQSGAAITGTKLWLAKYLQDSTATTWVTEEDYGAPGEMAFDLAVQPDGKIVVAGFSSDPPGTAVIRYLSDGSRDPSFNQGFGGFAANLTGAVGEFASGVAIQSNGGIVLAGSNSTSFYAARIGAPRLVTPTQLRFSSTRVGRTSKPQSLTLSNPGGAMLTDLQIRMLGSGRRDFQLLTPDETIAGGATVSRQVKFKPRRKGVRITDVQITTANAGSATVRFIGRGR
jgi:uncharacterized delta-60 repeat protein